MNIPLVSVIIPTYNRSHCILKTLDSVFSQTYKNVEILVIDDGSSDNTVEVLKSLKSKIILIQQLHKGQAAAKNKGLLQAKGEFIAPLDSDDLWNPDYLEKGIKGLLLRAKDIHISNWTQIIYDSDRVFLAKSHLSGLSSCLLNNKGFKSFIFKENLGANSGMIFKRDMLAKGWNEKVNIGDDWYLLIDLVLSNDNLGILYSEESTWTKNRFHDNICDGNKGEQFRKKHLQDIDLLLANFGSSLNKSQAENLYIKRIQNILLLSFYDISYLKYLDVGFKNISSLKIIWKAISQGVFRFIRKLDYYERGINIG